MTRIGALQRTRLFGEPCTPANLVTVLTPWGLKVRAHRLVADRFLYACQLAQDNSRWRPKRIDSYACRTVRGSKSTSLHAYGLAWDFFDKPLPQPVDVWGATNAPDEDFREAFITAGFTPGADFTSRKDFPHIEWADGLPKTLSGQLGRADSITPANVPAPLVKPITFTRLEEAAGMKVSTHFVDIPALDNNGRGWVDIPYPLERVLDVTGQGSSPPDDGYWAPLTVTIQPRGGNTRVTLAGKASQHVGVFYKLLEEP